MRYFWLFLLSMLLGSALADAPLSFTKTMIKIVPTAVAVPLDASETLMPSLHRIKKEFTVSVQPEQFLKQSDFFAQQPFTNQEGILISFEPARSQALERVNIMTPVDVLFISEDGTILKIAPDLQLSNMQTPIITESFLRALVFFKAGTTKRQDIQPGDRVENALFRPKPVIIEPQK